MLPFLKTRPQTGVIVQQTKTTEDSEDNQGLLSCAEDLIAAIHNKDPKAVKEALRAAFEICDSEPHEEGPHTNSYEDQNRKAALADSE